MADQGSLSLVRRALAEDLAGYGDITSALTVPVGLRGEADILAREDLVLCGMELAELVLSEGGCRRGVRAGCRRRGGHGRW